MANGAFLGGPPLPVVIGIRGLMSFPGIGPLGLTNLDLIWSTTGMRGLIPGCGIPTTCGGVP